MLLVIRLNKKQNKKKRETGNNGSRGVEIILPLKYLTNFWKTREKPVINLEIKSSF